MKHPNPEREKQVRTPKQERSLEKTARIRDAAKALFCEKGYFETTTNEIAKHAGLSIGTLYSYYTDKKAIYRALVEEFYLTCGPNEPVGEEIGGDLSLWYRIYFLLNQTIEQLRTQSPFQAVIRELSTHSAEFWAIEQQYCRDPYADMKQFLSDNRSMLKINDMDTSAILLSETIRTSALLCVRLDPELSLRLIRETTDMLATYFVKEDYLN